MSGPLRLVLLLAGIALLVGLVLLASDTNTLPRTLSPAALAAHEPAEAVPAEAAQRRSAAQPATTESTPSAEPTTVPASSADVRRLRLRGRVVDGTGEGVAHAVLVVLAPRRIEVAATDPGGALAAEFDLNAVLRDSLPSRRPTFEVTCPGYAAQRVELPLAYRPQELSEIDLGEIVLQPGVDLEGRVVDHEGSPVPRAHVRWVPKSRTPAGEAELEEDLQRIPGPHCGALDDGSFHFVGLPLQDGYLCARGVGTEFGWSELLRLSDSQQLASVVLEVHRLRPTYPLAGIVLSADGQALAGRHVSVRRPADLSDPLDVRASRGGMALSSGHVDSVYTDRFGAFRFDVVGEAPVDVRVASVGSPRVLVQTENVQPGTEGLVLQVASPTSVEVQVVDPTGKPIPWASVRVERELIALGKNGRGVVPVETPNVRFTAFAPAFAAADFGPFERDQLTELLTLELQPGPAVRGLVLAEGRPVPGARVAVTRQSSINQTAFTNESGLGFSVVASTRPGGHDATTNGRGEFVISLPNSATYALRVEADGFPPSTYGPFDWSAPGVHTFDADLWPAGSIEGSVRSQTALGNVAVGASNGFGVVYTSALDADGRYRIDNLQPGSWQVRLCQLPVQSVQVARARPFEHDVVWDVEVRSGRSARFDLDVDETPERILSGRLSGPEWQRGFVGHLRARGTPTWAQLELAEGQISQDGRFELRTRFEGDLNLCLRLGSQQLIAPLRLVPGRNRWERTIELGSLRCDGEASSIFHVWVGADGAAIFTPLEQYEGDTSDLAAAQEPRTRKTTITVPAGEGFVGRAPRRARYLPIEDWERLLDVTVPVGGTIQVNLDGL